MQRRPRRCAAASSSAGAAIPPRSTARYHSPQSSAARRRSSSRGTSDVSAVPGGGRCATNAGSRMATGTPRTTPRRGTSSPPMWERGSMETQPSALAVFPVSAASDERTAADTASRDSSTNRGRPVEPDVGMTSAVPSRTRRPVGRRSRRCPSTRTVGWARSSRSAMADSGNRASRGRNAAPAAHTSWRSSSTAALVLSRTATRSPRRRPSPGCAVTLSTLLT